MDNKEFFAALRQLAKEKKLAMSDLCDSFSKAIVTAVKKDYNNKDIVFCDIDEETDTIRVYLRKTVVTEIDDPDTDLTVDEAKRYKPTALAGDIIEIELDTRTVSRIAADKGKHLLRQGIREAERGQLRTQFDESKQEIVTVKVIRIIPESGDAVVEIGKIEEILPRSEQLPNDSFREGDLVKAFVVKVNDSARNLGLTLSRTHAGLVKRLLESEVPEIYDGTVEIKSIAREAGSRSKIAVSSSDENVDPVGACIGPKGTRVGKIVDLLSGEKIDIIRYSDNLAEFVAAALAPADVISVDIEETEDDEKGKVTMCRVVVPEDQLSLAIGNGGQNARLAANLTHCKVDINTETIL